AGDRRASARRLSPSRRRQRRSPLLGPRAAARRREAEPRALLPRGAAGASDARRPGSCAGTRGRAVRFEEEFVNAGGFSVRVLRAGEGDPLVHLHGGGGLHLSRAHELLAERFHLIAVEFPGFGLSPENTRTRSIRELAETTA